MPKTDASGVLLGWTVASAFNFWSKQWPAGLLALVGGVLKLTFGTPPAAPGTTPLSLQPDASRIEEDVTYSSSKFAIPNTCTLTGSFGSITQHAYGGVAPAVPVVVVIPTDYTDVDGGAQIIARMYLPLEPAAPNWDLEGVTWRPTDADLAALPFPLTLDTYAGTHDCYGAAVAITSMTETANPVTHSDYFGGCLAGATIRIVKGRILVDLDINRQIPDPTLAGLGITPAQIAAASYSAVTVNQIDPTLTVYATRLARKP
jgi:hypothetical protein